MEKNCKGCVVRSSRKKLSKLFNQGVTNSLEVLLNLKMPAIDFNHCHCENINITTPLGHFGYQILRCFAKCFTFNCSQRISAPNAELNTFEGMLLVRCGILTIENRRSSLLS